MEWSEKQWRDEDWVEADLVLVNTLNLDKSRLGKDLATVCEVLLLYKVIPTLY